MHWRGDQTSHTYKNEAEKAERERTFPRTPESDLSDQAITTLTGLLEVDESATFARIRQVILGSIRSFPPFAIGSYGFSTSLTGIIRDGRRRSPQFLSSWPEKSTTEIILFRRGPKTALAESSFPICAGTFDAIRKSPTGRLCDTNIWRGQGWDILSEPFDAEKLHTIYNTADVEGRKKVLETLYDVNWHGNPPNGERH